MDWTFENNFSPVSVLGNEVQRGERLAQDHMVRRGWRPMWTQLSGALLASHGPTGAGDVILMGQCKYELSTDGLAHQD